MINNTHLAVDEPLEEYVALLFIYASIVGIVAVLAIVFEPFRAALANGV